MPVTPLETQKKYMSILSDGHIHMTVDPETPGAKLREYETGDGTKGFKYELVFQDVSGYIKFLDFKKGDYGTSLYVGIKDDLLPDEEYVLTLNLGTPFAEDFMKKLPNIDPTQPVVFNPFSFKNEKNKSVRGITLLNGENKLTNYYYDVEKKEYLHKFPSPEGDTKKYDTDDWKAYFIKVRKFLQAETEKWATKHLPEDGSHIPVMEQKDEQAF